MIVNRQLIATADVLIVSPTMKPRPRAGAVDQVRHRRIERVVPLLAPARCSTSCR